MAKTKLKFSGTLTGFVPSFFDTPKYQGEPSDFRIKVTVTKDVDKLLNELQEKYEGLCDWYRDQTGKKGFYDEPWIQNDDGTITVRLTAKPKNEEFPFPVVDGELVPVDKGLVLKEGTEVNVSTLLMGYSPRSPKGGMRIRPQAIQVIKAVTLDDSTDAGDLNLDEEFQVTEGFKQSKPNVQKPASVPECEIPDPDF